MNCTFQPNVEQQNFSTDVGIKKSLSLFEQSSVYHASKHQDRNTMDVDYEKNCDQCTFQPDIHQKQQQLAQSFIPQKTFLQEKAIDNSVSRVKQARHRKLIADEIKKTGHTMNEVKRSIQQEKAAELDQHNFQEIKSYKEKIKQTQSSQQKKPQKKQIIPKKMKTKEIKLEQKPIENYQQFAFEQKIARVVEPQQEVTAPLLFVDVNIEEGQASRIIVHEGDTAQQLAADFARENNLDRQLQEKLEELLEQQIKNLLTKIEEEEENSENNPPQFQ